MAAALIVLRSTGFLVLASAANLGLVTIWIWAKVRARDLEAKVLKDDIQAYMDLVSGPLQNSDSHGAASVPSSQVGSSLTVRELQTLRLIAEGKTNKQVAQALHISPQTVKDHVARIFEKLDVATRRRRSCSQCAQRPHQGDRSKRVRPDIPQVPGSSHSDSSPDAP